MTFLTMTIIESIDYLLPVVLATGVTGLVLTAFFYCYKLI